MATRSPKPVLGALFLFLAAALAGVSFTAGAANGGGIGHWVISICAGLIAVWFVGLSIRSLRPR